MVKTFLSLAGLSVIVAVSAHAGASEQSQQTAQSSSVSSQPAGGWSQQPYGTVYWFGESETSSASPSTTKLFFANNGNESSRFAFGVSSERFILDDRSSAASSPYDGGPYRIGQGTSRGSSFDFFWFGDRDEPPRLYRRSYSTGSFAFGQNRSSAPSVLSTRSSFSLRRSAGSDDIRDAERVLRNGETVTADCRGKTLLHAVFGDDTLQCAEGVTIPGYIWGDCPISACTLRVSPATDDDQPFGPLNF